MSPALAEVFVHFDEDETFSLFGFHEGGEESSIRQEASFSSHCTAFNTILNFGFGFSYGFGFQCPKLCQYALKQLTFKATMEDLGPPLTIYLWCLFLHITHTHPPTHTRISEIKSRLLYWPCHVAFCFSILCSTITLEHQMNIMK